MTSFHDGFSTVETVEPVAAPLTGVRAFALGGTGGTGDDAAFRPVDDPGEVSARYGWLHGVFKTEYRWLPGVNTAACLVDGLGTVVATAAHAVHYPDLVIPEKECHCGLWAYTRGHHTLAVPMPGLLGVVEGWGRMEIGPFGFRAEYARIVALSLPDVEAVNPASSTPTGAPAPAAPAPSSGRSVSVVDPAAGATVKLSPELTAGLASIGRTLTTWIKTVGDGLARLTALLGDPTAPGPVRVVPVQAGAIRSVVLSRVEWAPVDDELLAAVHARYPGVPIYGDPVSMQNAHPVSDLTGYLPQPTPPEDT